MSIQHIRMIHCSDLHLDSPMEAHLSFYQAQTRRRELLRTFSRMAEYAADHDVRVILIAGDLFDSVQISSDTLDFFFHCVKEHPSLDFLYLPGNHDPEPEQFLSAVSDEFPDNLWILRSGPVHMAYTHVVTQRVYGEITVTGLTGPADQLPALQASCFNLVMLHGHICNYRTADHLQDQAFCYSVNDLSGRNIDYIAAGHLHQYQTGALDSRGTYCYSGCPEGRGFDECGEKGFVLLDISADHDSRSVTWQMIPFASRRLFTLQADISQAADYSAIDQQVEQILLPMNRSDLIRLELTGRIAPQLNLHKDWLMQKYVDDFYYFQIDDCTRPVISYEAYQYDISLKGEFIRLVLSSEELSEEEKEKVIMEGLRALAGEEILTDL